MPCSGGTVPKIPDYEKAYGGGYIAMNSKNMGADQSYLAGAGQAQEKELLGNIVPSHQ